MCAYGRFDGLPNVLAWSRSWLRITWILVVRIVLMARGSLGVR